MENAQNNMVYCLAGFQEFICSLGTNSPVSAYIPLTGIPILQECINGLEIRKNIPKWKTFQTQLPLLANMLQKIGMDSIPRELNPLLVKLISISKNLESFPEREVQISPTDFGVFPCLPLVRGRGFYQADTKQLHDECRDDFDCKKLHKNLKSLTPWCIYPLL